MCSKDSVHRRQRLHGVGGARGRGDRARGGLGHQQAAGRGDGDHDRRGAVARQAAHAVLVHDGRAAPVEALARLDHRARDRDRLGGVEQRVGAGGDVSGELDVGIAAVADVADDRARGVLAEAVAVKLAAHEAHRFDRRGVAELRVLAVGGAEQVPGGLGKAGFVVVQHVGGDHVHGGDDVPVPHRDLHAVLAAEALGAADVAVRAHVDHGLLVGVDAGASEDEEIVVHVSPGVVVARGFMVHDGRRTGVAGDSTATAGRPTPPASRSRRVYAAGAGMYS